MTLAAASSSSQPRDTSSSCASPSEAVPSETSAMPSSSSKTTESRSSTSTPAASTDLADSPSNLGSTFWSSWISPSSSSAVAASSAMEKRTKPRRPSFEEFRAEEPPQARLIRLRGLFDTLLDEDDEQALAGGRAREEWMKSARRARYGAGGSLARGSLAPSDIRNSTVGFEACTMSQTPSPDNTSSATTAKSSSLSLQTGAASSSSSLTHSQLPAPPPPPRQSYAKELLNQCRKCREEIEVQRARLAEESAKRASQPGWSSSLGLPTWLGGEKSEVNIDAAESSKSTLATVKDKILSRSLTSAQPPKEEAPSSSSSTSHLSTIGSYLGYRSDAPTNCEALGYGHNPPDMEHEAGWTGSGVWGLSAVGHKKRAADRDRDEKVRRGHKVDDDGGARQRQIEWEGFLAYAENKERELYKIFVEMDRNCDMRLDVQEIRAALDRSGIELPQISLDDFIASLTSTRASAHASGEKTYVTFPEFRDYLLLLPRKPSVPEIFRFYQVRKAFGLFGMGGIFAELAVGWGKTERGATAVNFDGDVSLAGEEKKRESPAVKEAKRAEKLGKRQEAAVAAATKVVEDTLESRDPTILTTASNSGSVEEVKQKAAESAAAAATTAHEAEEEEEEDNDMIHGAVALKFLVAGGIAGAVSRTATAPFDRLKIYLITTARAPEIAEATAKVAANGSTAKVAGQGVGILREALFNLYRDGGGLRAFWVGNGLNCLKIFPESAIKFLSYETAKRAFAKYVDHVSDSRDISGTSRFLSGGFGGITSQLAIYPVETLKTRLMSSQNVKTSLQGNALLAKTAKDMWNAGGVRTYYRGLTAGLIGVFPYSAIDMSTFEGIKLFYIKYTGKEEPGVLALLSFGSVSGSVGASTVYPLNLIRTRLQAAGTPAHPVTYNGFWDAARKTYYQEGLVGFYRGLVPTLAKVVPAVSISYVVYEQSKKRLGVQ
ncbi:related to SAL1 - member of the Ca2+-binding subfamily of the mitochondrial carrier family [Melanopsichium pennsylvanicum]|uniref:Related to SAL1 - member of the Ca2+-binding subfamily of the mitochondrial carrier family n=2 Tax=Melanopsichium pennsylvanicum TaxID=63383 RepID=A0AAJ4XII6_9BASI|nr:related to SAL1-member of the Ca2-binding subfamily of the mitochondrial carrier family [Melanopsichium pennsylvanicum 4]SNX82611.1 related to SAL1 - member of the Ca2+-binding subfamily of the mitochondrial carrier family [Melanopsichium pennsylvanicum]